ncbi:AAA family ATPase [Longimicrobium terrae]|uniref:Energy-coupling factor transporter ATP-binding protein EcfA2 n=1 Tax=Longimicrobium terrae TaxID=1639882 RepID=A0A841GRM1_9BACT|nr:ATP-binding protein [Longimicrobium terrae]MBB4635406.1 energy-coupling factor transporter ATP-binding protein EcfA2 [Longimicrobium terrae]MBB6069800.1 energy-coupling factor transporter ATP-binding protein EcfA2 [Longimicrobium terrae]NNC30991.1 AAA family ATPase [Longimicrobium terrae]
MDDMLLPSFTVEGFRAIRHLTLPELGRVNLIVGTNNAGKSSLLEALELFCERANERFLAARILNLVSEHSGYEHPLSSIGVPAAEEPEIVLNALEGLFYGSFNEGRTRPIVLGRAGEPGVMKIVMPWNEPVGADGEYSGERPLALNPDSWVLAVQTEANRLELDLEYFSHMVPLAPLGRSDVVAVPSAGLSGRNISSMWDRVLVLGGEQQVEEHFRSLVPGLEKILLIGEGRSRSILCRVRGSARPIPLRSMGDGTIRMFGLTLAMVLAAGGALLVDEVENGFHRSVHHDVWNSIFVMAEQLNVQVFATTHSWEAVVGFQDAANRSPAKGMLYRLDRKDDGMIRAVRYSERDVAIAADQQIEVR